MSQTAPPWPARRRLLALIAILFVGSLSYRLLVAKHLEQTSLLFIGLPALLAALVTLAGPAQSSLGLVMRSVTLFLLLSGILLGEGFICIVMAAPLFYLVGGIIWAIFRWVERKNSKSTYALALPLLLMSLEGTHEMLSFPRENTVTQARIVKASSAEVASRMAATPQFTDPLPTYLRLGFPRPASTTGEGLTLGSIRRIHFAGGEGKPGDATFAVVASGQDFVEFRSAGDTSHIAHWLSWHGADVRWRAIDSTHTRIEWTIRYRRLLDPSWYFHPWERYAVGLLGTYYLDSLGLVAAP